MRESSLAPPDTAKKAELIAEPASPQGFREVRTLLDAPTPARP